MSYRVLALKWRPQCFGDVAGQDHISRTLSNALNTGRAAHAYLFTGPRGVGKTTMARVLAKALNCEEGLSAEPCGACPSCREITSGSALDVIEIDGASNRGIDDIRDLREGVRYAPARLKTKVYIIDEVHMLTQEAFNALLKTLEEPPDHVVFVLATTEVLKVPQTILSRCQRFDFARLRSSEAVERMRFICEQEGIEADLDALAVLAAKGEGSMRDALTLLDQAVATGERPLTAGGVRQALGLVGRDLFFGWTNAIREARTSEALGSLARAVEGGGNLVELAEEFLLHLRNLLLVASDQTLLEQVDGTHEERAAYAKDAVAFEVADLLRFCRLLMDAITQMRRSGYPRVHLEVALAEMCALPNSVDLRRFVEAVKQRVGDPPDTPPRTETPRKNATQAAARLPKAPSASLAGGATEQASPEEGVVAPVSSPILSLGAEPEPVTVTPNPDADSADPLPTDAETDPWLAVLADVARVKPSLQGFLAGSSAQLAEPGVLGIEVPGSPMYVQMLQAKDNRRILVELVQTRYGKPLGLRFQTIPAEVAPKAGARASPPVTETGAIQRVADLFDGDVLGPA